MNTRWISEALRGQPFKLFAIRLSDGRTLHVPYPDFMAVSHRLAVFIHPTEDAVTWIEPASILSLEFANGAGAVLPPVNREQGNEPREEAP